MPGREIIGPRERELIAANLDLSTQDIGALLTRESGVIVSNATITKYVKLMREQAEEEGKLTLALIDNNIEGFIKERTNHYLQYIDDNIKQLNNIVCNKETLCLDKNGNYDVDIYLRVTKQMGEQICNILKLNPSKPGDNKPTMHIDVHANLEDILSNYRKETTISNAQPINKNDDNAYTILSQ
jgi:hypothetical protein